MATFFSYNVLNVNSLECLSMNNQECKIRSEIIIKKDGMKKNADVNF